MLFSPKQTLPTAQTPVHSSVSPPLDFEPIEEKLSRGLLGKVAGILQKSMLGLLDTASSATSGSNPQSTEYSSNERLLQVGSPLASVKLPIAAPMLSVPMSEKPSTASTIVIQPQSHFQPRHRPFLPEFTPRLKVKETKHVSLEYDPKTRRKVLNTYEIIREIGRGEHGKVKLARDLVHDELVAIKIVSRKLKRDRQLRMRRPSNAPPNYRTRSDYETKIRREIAIMKRCDHKYIVKLREVLDDLSLFKIYLVLEHMERGEIKWKRQYPIQTPRPLNSAVSVSGAANVSGGPGCGEHIPCLSANKRGSVVGMGAATEDNDLLSNEFSPNLTFRQSRRIFRDVLLGLEYLHMQGIVHRDIKPANLLVSSDYIVKISDFGVSFASLLGSSDDGVCFNDMELAKTVGTPAFFAPELCQTSLYLAVLSAVPSSANLRSGGAEKNEPIETFEKNESSEKTENNKEIIASSSRKLSESLPIPKVDHKIDIWAFGVTLYCLLFGRVPFNADNEFALFDVIVHEPLEFPATIAEFHSPQEVTNEEFDLAKDLISKMLEKDSRRRIDISEIKQHPFVLMDLENDLEKLHELFFLNDEYNDQARALASSGNGSRIFSPLEPTPEELNSSVVGVGRRIRSDLLRVVTSSDTDIGKRLALRLEQSTSLTSSSGSSSRVGMLAYGENDDPDRSHTILLLEAMSVLQSRENESNGSPSYTLSPGSPCNPSGGEFSPFTPQMGLAPAFLALLLLKLPQLNVGAGGSGAVGTFSSLPLANVSPLMLQPNIASRMESSSKQVLTTLVTHLAAPLTAHLTSQLLTSSVHVHRRPSAALSNLLLQEVLDTDASLLRRDSIGSTEAPQIETKRNVGGDLYLKNQSALEAFKDIQKSDQRRRGSLLFLSLSRSSSISGGRKNSRVLDDLTALSSISHARVLPADLEEEFTSETPNSKIKIGPISIEGNRRPSLVISMPLTESFASLDSDNDDYLSRKYSEFRKHREAANSANAGNSAFGADPLIMSDPDISKKDALFDQMGDKFKNFNLTSLMATKKSEMTSCPGNGISSNLGDPGSVGGVSNGARGSGLGGGLDLDPIHELGGPKSNVGSNLPKREVFSILSPSCLTSGELASSASSSTSGRSSDSDEEEGNLTLKFSSKIVPVNRPPFLSLANRAISHDSRLPELGHAPSPVTYEVPFMFQNNSLELEDVPESLMGRALEGISAEMTPTTSIKARSPDKRSPPGAAAAAVASAVASNSAFKNVANDKSAPGSSHANAANSHRANAFSSGTNAATASTNGAGVSTVEDHRLRLPKKSVTHSSPLRWEIGRLEESQQAEIPSSSKQCSRDSSNGSLHAPVNAGYFNNHYKKERTTAPFPFAKHLQSETKDHGDKERPGYLRSNSITVAILQNDRTNE